MKEKNLHNIHTRLSKMLNKKLEKEVFLWSFLFHIYTLDLCCAGAPGAETGGDPGAEKGGDLLAELGLGDPDLVAPVKADEMKSANSHKNFVWTLCSC